MANFDEPKEERSSPKTEKESGALRAENNESEGDCCGRQQEQGKN